MIYFTDRTKKIFNNILKYTLELLIVAFGVFFGSYVSERNNQQKTDLNTQKALTQIISELNTNTLRLEKAIQYHQKINHELDSLVNLLHEDDFETPYFQNKEKFNHNNIPSWTGFQVARMANTVYESAKISGVFQELNIHTIQLISGIYSSQDEYTELSKQTMNKMLDMDSDTKTRDIIGTLQRLVKYDNVSMEKSLLAQLKEITKELEEIKEGKTYKK